MSVFDDDEQEEGTPGSRVAAALNPVEEEEPADDGADTRATSQEDAKDKADKDAPNDATAEQVAKASPYEGVNNPPDEEIHTDEEVSPDAALAQGYGNFTPIKAPVAPTLKPMSDAPIEQAQALANAKSDFAQRQAAGAFKPSIGRRIAAGLAAGMVGFGTRNAAEGLNVGEGITNAPLDRARRDEAAKEQGIQSNIDTANLANQRTGQENAQALAQYKLDESNMRNQAYAQGQQGIAEWRRAQADAKRDAITNWTPKDANNPYAGGTGRTADGRTVENVPPPDKWVQQWAKTPEGQAAAVRMSVDARRKVADSIFGKGNNSQKQEYIATGKISRAASVKVPSAQLEEYNDWKSQFQKEHGRAPNAAEIQGWGHSKGGTVSKNLMDRIESQKNTQIQSAEKDYQNKLIDKDEYLNRWQAAQDEFEQRISDATGEDIHHVTIRDNVDPNTLKWHGEAPAQPKQQQQAQQQAPKQAPAVQQAKPQQAAQPSAPAAGPKTFQYKGQTFAVNQNITVGGKPAVVTGFNPKTGKPIVKIQGQ